MTFTFKSIYLIGGDCDELRWRKRKCLDNFLRMTSAGFEPTLDLDNVNARLVLVEAVQHDLALARRLVGQLDLSKADWVLGPVAAVVW